MLDDFSHIHHFVVLYYFDVSLVVPPCHAVRFSGGADLRTNRSSCETDYVEEHIANRFEVVVQSLCNSFPWFHQVNSHVRQRALQIDQ